MERYSKKGPRIFGSAPVRLMLGLAAACYFTGCSSAPPAPAKPSPAPPPDGKLKSAPPSAPLLGRVLTANSSLRFVLIGFAGSRMPELQQRLGVYRNGQKIGEVKISGPYRGLNVAADITAGEAAANDEIRQ